MVSWSFGPVTQVSMSLLLTMLAQSKEVLVSLVPVTTDHVALLTLGKLKYEHSFVRFCLHWRQPKPNQSLKSLHVAPFEGRIMNYYYLVVFSGVAGSIADDCVILECQRVLHVFFDCLYL